DFGDGTTSNEIVTQHAYSSPGNYIVTLTVSDGEYNVSQSITLTINANLVISEVNCFDKVTRGKKQVCSVKVENNINQAVGNSVVRIIDTSRNIELANCITDDLSGGCSAEFTVSTPNSTQEIKVEAHKNGYDDATPRFLTFEVLDQRYELREFEIFNDANYSTPSTTFYRGDSVYVKFKVYDLEEGKYTTDNVITQATLISYDAGGYILLENDSNADSAEPEYKHFKVEIPLSHFFIGESAVFGFAINFVDNSMGQADKKVTILNNPPEIVSEIPTITITEINQTVTLNLSDYAYDKEDGTALEWRPYSYYSSILDVEVINGSLLKIKPKAAVQVPTKVILRVYDLDNDYASTTVTILLNITNNPPQPPSECFVGETRKCGPETDKGICEYGIQRCIDGHWDECVGAVYPQPEVENGLDDNCNGLIDEGFTKTSRDEIGFGRITYTSELNSGDNLNVNVNLENKKGEDVQFSVLVLLPELGIGKRVLLNADAGESVHRFIQLEIPKNVKPGDYLLRISVNNGEFNRIKHRIITIR
ncbi:MAG: hypothetical protein PWP03_732, partial [Candidatus Woesearchaeota archaeon]|nr:hypothetical protein [Candidatus Woesearchaeota archaeon]